MTITVTYKTHKKIDEALDKKIINCLETVGLK